MTAPLHLHTEEELGVQLGQLKLVATLTVPDGAHGAVVFAHGSGSSRYSIRNRAVARRLHESGLATLLADLLTAEEEDVDIRTRHLRFDIDFLAERVSGLLGWCRSHADLGRLPLGLFGASTGSAAALSAAARSTPLVRALVSRGGRPDLAGEEILKQVDCPTLLIVGERDSDVLDLNRIALQALGSTPKKLVIVPGAGHLFEEPGRLDIVAELAGDWFNTYFDGGGDTRPRLPYPAARRKAPDDRDATRRT